MVLCVMEIVRRSTIRLVSLSLLVLGVVLSQSIDWGSNSVVFSMLTRIQRVTDSVLTGSCLMAHICMLTVIHIPWNGVEGPRKFYGVQIV
ncbi:hypothetical protein AHF37_11999 [Paragonimus kellicotti]|nr:hypothetical protein AHF37_11999 [Paragonimus kellicotti]